MATRAAAKPTRDLIGELAFLTRLARGRAAVPDHHRARGASLHRDRDQPAVQQWGSVFPDPRPLVAAIVDRVTFNTHIIETGTQSYRLRTSKTTARRKRAS